MRAVQFEPSHDLAGWGRRLVGITSSEGDNMSSTPPSRDELIAEVVRRYLSGESIRTVASAIGRSYGLVQGVLKQAGVKLRAPGTAPHVTSSKTLQSGDVKRDAAMAVHPSAGAVPEVSDKTKAAAHKPKGPKAGKPAAAKKAAKKSDGKVAKKAGDKKDHKAGKAAKAGKATKVVKAAKKDASPGKGKKKKGKVAEVASKVAKATKQKAKAADKAKDKRGKKK